MCNSYGSGRVSNYKARVFNQKFDDLKFSKPKMLRFRNAGDSVRNPWPFESSKTEVGRKSYGPVNEAQNLPHHKRK